MLSLPILPDQDDIQAQIDAERKRLLAEAGLDGGQIKHFKRPHQRRFSRAQRDQTTILFGGLTLRHDQLILAGLQGLGYTVAQIPTPRKADFQAGKEYGNNGQCNPTYFTVGALVNYLKDLRDKQGIPTSEILDRYLFFTAGACGPCRFGMYEAEYRLALRNSGFDGFRVLLFQQKGGLDQAAMEAGLEFNVSFFLTLLNAFFIGDLLNELAYQIRPYEVVPGQTDAVFQRCMQIMQEQFRNKNYADMHGGRLARVVTRLTPMSTADDVQKLLDQLAGSGYQEGLKSCLKLIQEEIEVDFTRPKPVCKITGEFWAQTTEGDGNFHMFSFLESQGAEVLVEPIATWIMYMVNQALTSIKDAKGLVGGERQGRRGFRRFLQQEMEHRKKVFALQLARRMILREYNRYRAALGSSTHEQIDQQQPLRRRRRASRGGQEHLLHQQRADPHGAEPETIRLYAQHAIRRSPGRGDRQVPRYDLHPHRDLW
jgi:predicted nucleotide-binding protein (sugar kinase/HSP70/actin superfamily)